MGANSFEKNIKFSNCLELLMKIIYVYIITFYIVSYISPRSLYITMYDLQGLRANMGCDL